MFYLIRKNTCFNINVKQNVNRLIRRGNTEKVNINEKIIEI